MKQTVGFVLALSAMAGSLPASASEGATATVDCDAGGTIGTALTSLQPGDTLLVKGTCRENVAIRAERNRLTLDGQGQATINAPDPGPGAVSITGREIVLKGFTITGGRTGVQVLRGGTALIANNVIHHVGGPVGRPAAGAGVNVGQHSFARLIGNTIRDNLAAGILVHESGAVRIGFIDGGNPAAEANTIENNAGPGITVATSASARIVGNTIRRNGQDGVAVSGGSNAQVSGNVISGNGGSGISVTQSSVQLGRDEGEGLLGAPNSTDPTLPNRGAGLTCAVGGSVDGRLGSLNGREGPKRFDKKCIDSLR